MISNEKLNKQLLSRQRKPNDLERKVRQLRQIKLIKALVKLEMMPLICHLRTRS